MEAAHFEKHGTTAQMSEQQLLDCSDMLSDGCKGGWYDRAWNYVRSKGGILTQAKYPYAGRMHIGHCMVFWYGDNDHRWFSKVNGCHGGPNLHGILEPSYCRSHGKVGDEAVLKTMLNDRPVAVAVDASSFQFYSSGILRCGNSHRLNHAVFAVGYESNSYWIIKNSWGTSWGESGYVRIGMGGNPCGVADWPAYAIAA